MLTYEYAEPMSLVRAAARLLKKEGETVLYRQAFRWTDDATGHFMPNMYEMQDIHYLAKEFNFEVLHDFHHVAVIRPTTQFMTGAVAK